MREREVTVPSPFGLAGVLCLPEDASAADPAPAIALLGGWGADTRDGDLEPGWPPGTTDLPAPGTLRRIAHRLAGAGVATLRYDRRGFGTSGGGRGEADYDSDLEDALAGLSWLRARPEVNPARVAVAGHSAGALTTCQVCREDPDVAGAMLLGGLASSIEDLIRDNLGRARRHWSQFSVEQRAWLESNMPALLVRAEGVERFLEAAKRGDDEVVLEGRGITVEMRTRRVRQDLATDYAAEFRHVRCPALVLQGGGDLNVPVADALTAYRVLRGAGNDAVQLTVLPGLDHYFNPVPADPVLQVWNRVSLEGLRRPMAPEALDVMEGWAVRTLRSARFGVSRPSLPPGAAGVGVEGVTQPVA
jgi:pimeloyl-ACP methyl ester carboxylesterase